MFGTTFVEAVTMFYGAEKVKEPFILYMQTQNIELTRSIAAAYYYEPLHTKALELYSHVIIAGLKKKSGLTKRDEFLLQMAIILYQIGKYVNLLDSQAHAWNLIRGTDIFGISDKEKDIVAQNKEKLRVPLKIDEDLYIESNLNSNAILNYANMIATEYELEEEVFFTLKK